MLEKLLKSEFKLYAAVENYSNYNFLLLNIYELTYPKRDNVYF